MFSGTQNIEGKGQRICDVMLLQALFTAHLFILVSEVEGCREEYLGTFLVLLLPCLGSFSREEAFRSQETTYFFFLGEEDEDGHWGSHCKENRRSLQDHSGVSC